MSTTIFHSASAHTSLFLLVRSHSQLQYYLNLSNTRRAANDAGVGARNARPAEDLRQSRSW